MNKCKKCGAFITEAMVLCDSCAVEKNEGELKKRFRKEAELTDDDYEWIEFVKVVDEAKKDLPPYPEPLSEKEYTSDKWIGMLDQWDSDMQKWIKKWFGDYS